MVRSRPCPGGVSGQDVDGGLGRVELGDEGAVDIGGDSHVDFMQYGVNAHCEFGWRLAAPLDEIIGAHGIALQAMDLRRR